MWLNCLLLRENRTLETSSISFTQQSPRDMDGLKLVAINAMGNTEYLIGAHKWLGLKSIAMVESQREMNGKVSIEQRYYILSIHSDVQRFATAVRSHWSIENQLHWILDVCFAEDAAQSCQGYSAENLAVIRHVGINL